MKTVSDIANKFAMKLGLESRPSSASSLDYDDIYTDVPDETSEETLNYLGKDSESVAVSTLASVKVTIHDLTEKLTLGDFDSAVELIEDAIYDLSQLKDTVANKLETTAMLKARASGTLPYGQTFLDPSLNIDSDEGTIFQDIEEAPRKPEAPRHLSPLMREYLKDLDHMDAEHLWLERRKLRGKIRELSQSGVESMPYPLKLRLDEIDKRLTSRIR